MAFDRLRQQFSAVALAATLALTPTFAAAEPAANTNQPQAQTVSAQTISYSQNAMREATGWSMAHKDGVAIAVLIGTQREVTPERIEEVLRKEFSANGVSNVVFLYEEYKDALATGFTLHADGATYGVYTIRDVKQNVPKVAQQVKLLQNPAFAAN
jgi:hypothetical protein